MVPRLLGMVLRWTALGPMALLVQAMAIEFWIGLRDSGVGYSSLAHPLALAFLGGILLRVMIRTGLRRLGRSDPLDFVDTLEHELTHALMGYLTLAPPISLSATLQSGGEVQLKGANPLAALAPYFLPLWGLCAVLVGLVVRPGMQAAWNALVFFLLGAFAYRLSREFHWRQSDLHRYGFLFSLLAVPTLLLACLGIILHARGVLSWHWLTGVWPRFRESVEWLVNRGR